MVPTQVGILNYYIVVVQSEPNSELAIEANTSNGLDSMQLTTIYI